MTRTVGIILMAYGTPQRLEDVGPYFKDIRGGRTPSPEAVAELTERYRKVGGKTALLEITQETAERLGARLGRDSQGVNYRCYAGMKHWHPYIASTIAQMVADGVDEIVGLPLAPHYSKMSIDGYRSAVIGALEAMGADTKVRFIDTWYANPLFIDMMSTFVRSALAQFSSPPEEVETIFSAHSLPRRILSWGDPYPGELLDSALMNAERVGLRRWRCSYQSAGHTGDPWLGPDILETISALASEGKKAVLIVPIGFVSEHLEILFHIDTEAMELAEGLGIELRRTEMPNASAPFLEVLADIVLTGAGAREASGMPGGPQRAAAKR
ncbi:MAG: ferrochelatase [SAR202 cluster bacterium]|nr:ferrochelatase [SAR202 cluster bacterium]